MQTTYFFGSNTPYGFIKANDEPLNAEKVIILKGSAGSGKSTIIKKINEIAKNCGYDSVIYRCSSDSASLDGLFIKTLNCAVVDGTPPHNVEATYPLTKHFVFNLSDKADLQKINHRKNFINECIFYKKQYFTYAYCYLNSAYSIQSNINNIVKNHIDYKKIKEIANNILSTISININDTHNINRYCSAITDNGVRDYYDDNFYDYNIINLLCNDDIVCSELLNTICIILDADRASHIKLMNPFSKNLIEGVITGDTLITYKHSASLSYNLNDTVSTLDNISFKEDITIINNLIGKAIKSITDARNMHMEMEKCYYDAMDWCDVNNKTNEIINLIFNN